MQVQTATVRDDRDLERGFRQLRDTAVDPRVALTEDDPAWEHERQLGAQVRTAANVIAATGRPIADQVQALEDYLASEGLPTKGDT